MTGGAMQAIGVRATVLSPFHYHSLPAPSGTATQPEYLTDRQMSFALAGTLGCLSSSPALPRKDYRGHLAALPFLASVFETKAARLLPPRACRLNIDAETGFTLATQQNTSTGNLKTYFFIQEVPPGVMFEGAVFGVDPFALAAEAEGRPVHEIVVRTGRHRTGLLRLERAEPVVVRLNAHTAALFGRELPVETYAMHDLQVTPWLSLADAAAEIASWRN